MSLSLDANILLPAVENTNPHHAVAMAFFGHLDLRADVVLSELILLELYGLLRNPAVVPKARTAAEAVAICAAFRSHPRWQVVGLPADSRAFHDAVWARLSQPNFARRRAYDWRAALSLQLQGVDEFATVNPGDFADFGFKRLWNPLADVPKGRA